MSAAGKPAALSRAATACAAVVTLPTESVVLISISSLKISLARASFGADCAETIVDASAAAIRARFMAGLYVAGQTVILPIDGVRSRVRQIRAQRKLRGREDAVSRAADADSLRASRHAPGARHGFR